MTPEEVLRRKRRVSTPGFAGGTLEDQISKIRTDNDAFEKDTVRRGLPSFDEAVREQDANRAAGRPVWTTHAEGWGSPSGWQQLPRDEAASVGQGEPTLNSRNRAAPNRPPRPVSDPTAPPNPFGEQEPPTIEGLGAPPPVPQFNPIRIDPTTGRPEITEKGRTGDPLEVQSRYQGALQNWEPHGAKRGFKNSLKAGLMMMGEAVRANPDDPVTAAIAGFGAGLGGATAAPNFTNRLRRKQKLEKLGGELKSQFDLQKTQSQIDQTKMVEVELDNGQRVMVPAKAAGALQSRQQEIDLRGNTLEARKKRWNQLGEHEVAGDAQRLYNSGAADDSAELRAEIARRLRLPSGTVLPPRGLGNQIKLDEFGNYVIISPRSGAVTPTTTPAGKPAGSFETTKEGNRDVRQRRAITAQNERTKFVQEQQNRRAALRGTGSSGGVKLSAGERQEIARGIGAIERVKRELTAIDNDIKAAQGDNAKLIRLGRLRQQKVDEGAAIATELNALDPNNETGSGQGGYPYRKPREAQQASDLDRPIYPNAKSGGRYSGQRFSRAKVHERAKSLGMTVEQAEKAITDGGGIIY